MNTHSDKRREDKSQLANKVVTQKQSVGQRTVQFVDNRAGAIIQRKLQAMADKSSKQKELSIFQQMANNSSLTEPAAIAQVSGGAPSPKHGVVSETTMIEAPLQRMTFPEYESAARAIMEGLGKAAAVWASVSSGAKSAYDGVFELELLLQDVAKEVEKAGEKLSFRKPLEKIAQATTKEMAGYLNELLEMADDELNMEGFNLSVESEKEADLEKFSDSGIVAKNSALIKDRIDEQSTALEIHDTALKEEAEGGNKHIHGRGRHGFQTGVEGQIKRAKTKVTPDQPFDEMGLGRSTDTWESSEGIKMINAPRSVMGNSIKEGQAVSEESYDTSISELGEKKANKVRKSGGPYAGSFFSPEHQNKLIASALQKANNYLQWDEAQFTEGGWQKIQYFDVILKEQQGGYGISFSKGKGKETEFVLKIKDSSLVSEKDNLDVYLMMCAKVQLKRKENGWVVLSSFPENLPPGISPIYKHGKDPWTGNLRNSSTEATTKITPPDWEAH